MKSFRLIISIIVGLIIITLIVEIIEFLIVILHSGENIEILSTNQEKYFSYRNKNGILIAKILYSLVVGYIAGYLVSLIAKERNRTAIYLLIFLQIATLIYGGFVSNMKSTGPLWMWIGLIVVIPIGLLLGNKMYVKQFALKK